MYLGRQSCHYGMKEDLLNMYCITVPLCVTPCSVASGTYVSLFCMQAQNAKELWLLVEALDPVSDCYLWAEVSSVFLSPVVYIRISGNAVML